MSYVKRQERGFPTKICTVFGSTLRKMQDFSVNSRSAGPLGSSINVLFLIIHIWWSVSAFFPGSCWTARSSGPRWTERSAGKIDLWTCVVFTLCSKPRNTQAHADISVSVNTRPHVWCCLHVLTYVSQNHWATAYKPNVKTHTQADVLQGSPVCCYPCVIVCCFCLGATRKGGTIWTQRPTRTHGECGIVCVERSQINIQWSVLYFLIYLQQLLLWLHGTWKAGCSL